MVTFNDQELIEITEVILARHQLDFRNYAKSSLSRRITRIMTINAFNTKEDLLKYINEIENVDAFVEEITVNTTEMFRDPSFWLSLRNTILPELNTHENIRIWHAGCSTGEEVISMQILLRELGMTHKTTAYATDIDSAVINKAQERTYHLKNLELNQSNYKAAGGEATLSNFFKETSAIAYTFDEELLANVTFKRFDLVRDIMYTKFDLILCRNVLIYFDFVLQEMVIQKFCTNLFSNGFVAIGQKETILSAVNLSELNLYDEAEKIYKHKK